MEAATATKVAPTTPRHSSCVIHFLLVLRLHAFVPIGCPVFRHPAVSRQCDVLVPEEVNWEATNSRLAPVSEK